MLRRLAFLAVVILVVGVLWRKSRTPGLTWAGAWNDQWGGIWYFGARPGPPASPV